MINLIIYTKLFKIRILLALLGIQKKYIAGYENSIII